MSDGLSSNFLSEGSSTPERNCAIAIEKPTMCRCVNWGRTQVLTTGTGKSPIIIGRWMVSVLRLGNEGSAWSAYWTSTPTQEVIPMDMSLQAAWKYHGRFWNAWDWVDKKWWTQTPRPISWDWPPNSPSFSHSRVALHSLELQRYVLARILHLFQPGELRPNE